MKLYTPNLVDTANYFQASFFDIEEWGPVFNPSYDSYYKEIYTNRIVSILKRNSRNVVFQPSVDYYSGLEGQTVQTENSPIPSPIHSKIWKKTKVSNSPFSKKKRAGEIVVAPYDVTMVEVTSYPGFFAEAKWPNVQGVSLETESMYNQLGLRRKTIWGREVFLVSDRIGCFQPVMQFTYGMVDGWWLDAYPLSADDVANDLINSREVDVGIVTQAVAEANKQTLDALTALAEMPETVRSFIELTKQVARLLTGLKRKEFSLTRQFEKRKLDLKNRLQAELRKHDERIRRARMYSEKFSDRAQARNLVKIAKRSQQRAIRNYERDLKLSGIEFNDALANIWMNFRYNIMPTVYLAIDLTEVLTKNPSFLTVRRGGKPLVELQYGGFPKVEVLTQFLVWIKTKVEDTSGPFQFAKKGVSANIATTSWELISKSFVVDWFINLGDFITALLGGSDWTRERSVSFKQLIDYDMEDDHGRRLTIIARCYNRKLFSENQYTCLKIEPDMNPLRYTDSLAMLWAANRETLIRSIHSGSKSRS